MKKQESALSGRAQLGQVFSTELGYSEEEIEALHQEDVLYQAPEVERLPEEAVVCTAFAGMRTREIC